MYTKYVKIESVFNACIIMIRAWHGLDGPLFSIIMALKQGPAFPGLFDKKVCVISLFETLRIAILGHPDQATEQVYGMALCPSVRPSEVIN